ncbi:zf-HC2 domain-containing protein [Microbacterium sp. A93]|uniref:zf-HC2 domain-containing protein n=1 Tax=Microbacterium sp. A93 TaxID=3450716 RepID=UPI003F42AFF0
MAVFHPRARLDSYVEHALPPVSRARVAAHLTQCGECRREVSQRERILQVASSVQSSHPSRPVSSGSDAASGDAAFQNDEASSPPSTTQPVLETRDGVAGWKVVAGMGALGLTAVVVLSAAWIAGDPEFMAGAGDGGQLLPAAASPSAVSPPATVTEDDVGPSAERDGSPAAHGAQATAQVTGGSVPDDSGGDLDAVDRDNGGDPDPAVLRPAGVDGGAVSSSTAAADAAAGDSGVPGVALAGAVALTPDMVADLRQHGWNVPSLNGFGLRNDSTGWALAGDAAEVVMTLRGDGASMVLHECRSLAGDAEEDGAPGCPVGAGLTGAGEPAEGLALAGETRELPVGVEMSVLDHGDGTWTATARTAQAAYTVESDLPVERADRLMSLVVISERSRVQSGLAPERPADRLARGFERLMPWMAEPGYERR